MDKEQHHHQATAHNSRRFVDSFAPLDGDAAPEEQQQPSGGEMVDYMLGQPQAHHHAAAASQQQQPITQNQMSSLDKLSFSDVLHFADFGPKLALNNNRSAVSAERDDDDDEDDDDSYFFRFQSLPPRGQQQQNHHVVEPEEGSKTTAEGGGTTNISESTTLVQQQQQQQQAADKAGKSGGGRRKRPRTVKTSEEVESQRMTHIAVERNRRRQMNEYLRVLRSLMPGSYVQRGDQASIIGGAIEFIRELEQLIQCLESQKRRRLYGDAPRPPLVADATAGAGAPPSIQQPQPPPFFSPSLPFPTASGGSGGSDGGAAKILDLDVVGAAGGLGNREELAENKSCLADIEVRALGPDAMIKILSRRRPGQLIKTIAALEEMQMNILHTNVTTIEQTVLYSFNVKIAGDARFSAEDIAGAVHQILSFIDINYTI